MVTLNLPTGRNVAIRSLGASQVQQGNGHSLGRCTRQDGSPPHSPRLFCPSSEQSRVPLLVVPLRVEPGTTWSHWTICPPPPRQAPRDVPEFWDPPIQDRFSPCVVEPLAAPHHQRQRPHCEETRRNAVHKQVWCLARVVTLLPRQASLSTRLRSWNQALVVGSLWHCCVRSVKQSLRLHCNPGV